MDAIADQRIQRRAQGQRQAVAEAEERQRERHRRVDRPGVQSPMKEGDLHGLARGLDGAALAHGWRHEVHDGFGHAEEHQPDAHAGGKQHGEPGEIAVIGLAMIRAELDVAIPADRQERDRDQDDGDDQDVEPACIADDPGLHRFEEGLRCLGRNDGEGHQQQREDGRGIEDGPMDGRAWPGFRSHGCTPCARG